MDILETLMDVPPVELLGEAMLALNERQRRFVCAYAVLGGSYMRECYKAAGYETKGAAATSSEASRLAAMPEVVAAMQEEAHRRKNIAPLLAINGLIEMASHRNPDQKLRLKACNSLLDRVGGFGPKSEATVFIKDERTTEELLAYIQATTEQLSADSAFKLIKAPVIEAEFEEVVLSSEGIEDLL